MSEGDGFNRIKVYEPDPETGKDYKGYAMTSSVHQQIREWQQDHTINSITDTLKDIVNAARSARLQQAEIKRLNSQLEIYEGKANLSGIALDKPLHDSMTQQVTEQVEKERIQDQLKELKKKLSKSEKKLEIKQSKYAKLKKRHHSALAQLDSNQLDVNGLLSDAIKNPTALGTLINSFKGNQNLGQLPEGKSEADEFLDWFNKLFPEESHQDSIIDILSLLSSNPNNIPAMLAFLQKHQKGTKNEEHEA